MVLADRLWIQRPLPKPPQSHKRKRLATGNTNVRKGNRTSSEPVTKKNRKYADAPDEVVTPKFKQTPGRSTRQGLSYTGAVSTGRGGGRAAKTQAKMKMDAQAKDLAEFQRQTAAAVKSKGKSPAQPPPAPKGTRLSKRLRGSMEEEDWQPVPDEWLADSNASPPVTLPSALPKTGLESDDESALTSLSDDEDEDATPEEADHEEADRGKSDANGHILDDRGLEMPPELPSDFIEWETVGVSMCFMDIIFLIFARLL